MLNLCFNLFFVCSVLFNACVCVVYSRSPLLHGAAEAGWGMQCWSQANLTEQPACLPQPYLCSQFSPPHSLSLLLHWSTAGIPQHTHTHTNMPCYFTFKILFCLSHLKPYYFIFPLVNTMTLKETCTSSKRVCVNSCTQKYKFNAVVVMCEKPHLQWLL